MVPDTKHAIAVLGAVANSFVLFAILLQLVVTQLDSSSTAAMDFEENKMSPKLAEKKKCLLNWRKRKRIFTQKIL